MTDKNPYDAIGPTTWLYGLRLGVLVIGFFIGGALLAMGLLQLTGADMAHSVFVGVLLGPFIGTVAFAIFWKLTRPQPKPPMDEG